MLPDPAVAFVAPPAAAGAVAEAASTGEAMRPPAAAGACETPLPPLAAWPAEAHASMAALPVSCGPVRGVMLLARQRILTSGGAAPLLVTPTEFERIGGRGACKQWRTS